MKLVKVLSIILALLLAGAVILTSCQSSGGENTKDKPSNKKDKSELSDKNNNDGDDNNESEDKSTFSWTFADGVLTISGKGKMPDYDYYNSESPVPWWEYTSDITTVVIEDGITTIGKHAFNVFHNLTSITIPNSVTSIGVFAFANCTNLESIIIPDSVTSIGNEVFVNCSNLTSITIPDSVTSIGFGAFSYCDSLTDIHFGGTREEWNAMDPDNMDIPQNATVHCSDGDI